MSCELWEHPTPNKQIVVFKIAITAWQAGKQEACLYQKQYISKLLPGSTESSPDENISNICWSNIKPQHRLLSLSTRGVVEIIFSACAQFCSLINGIQLFCLHFLPLLVFLTNSFTQHNHWNFQQFDRIKIFRTSRNCSIFFWFCSSKPGRDRCRNVQHKEGRPACLHHLEPPGWRCDLWP